jgi:hypothetical protein
MDFKKSMSIIHTIEPEKRLAIYLAAQKFIEYYFGHYKKKDPADALDTVELMCLFTHIMLGPDVNSPDELANLYDDLGIKHDISFAALLLSREALGQIQDKLEKEEQEELIKAAKGLINGTH